MTIFDLLFMFACGVWVGYCLRGLHVVLRADWQRR